MLVSLASLSGCQRKEPGQTELVIWSNPSGVEEQAFLRMCRRFEQEHPGVRVRNVGRSDETKLIRAIVAAAPPDMAYIYGTALIGPLAVNSGALPLDAYFVRAGFHDADFLPGAIEQARYQGRLYAMPMTRDCHSLYRSRTRLREAGLDPDKPPRTLEELIEFGKRLTIRAPDGSLEKLGVYLPPDPEMVFALFGGDTYDTRTGHITANTPQNIAALRWLIALADAQGGYRAVRACMAGFGSDDTNQNPLATGKIALRLDGEWAAMHLEKYALGCDYALSEIPYPAQHPELKNLAWQNGDTLIIPTGSHHPDLAWTFMAWMEQPAQQLVYAPAMSNLPSILALKSAPELRHGTRSRRALGYVLTHIASDPKNARWTPPLPVTALYGSALRNAFDRALFHEISPEQALNEVQERIEREMRRYDRP